MVRDITGFLLIFFFMLDIEFTTFYSEMHGNDRKKQQTQYKDNIKLQYTFSSSFVSITHYVSVLEAKHLFSFLSLQVQTSGLSQL